MNATQRATTTAITGRSPDEQGQPAQPIITPHWHRMSSGAIPYLFVAPQIVLFSVFMFFPLGYAAFLSLHRWDPFEAPRFVGGRNYVHLVSDPVFWFALKNTLIYVVGTVPLSIGLGLLLAI